MKSARAATSFVRACSSFVILSTLLQSSNLAGRGRAAGRPGTAAPRLPVRHPGGAAVAGARSIARIVEPLNDHRLKAGGLYCD